MNINWRSPLVTRVGILLATMVVFATVLSSPQIVVIFLFWRC
jgi:hypothetical protein